MLVRIKSYRVKGLES